MPEGARCGFARPIGELHARPAAVVRCAFQASLGSVRVNDVAPLVNKRAPPSAPATLRPSLRAAFACKHHPAPQKSVALPSTSPTSTLSTLQPASDMGLPYVPRTPRPNQPSPASQTTRAHIKLSLTRARCLPESAFRLFVQPTNPLSPPQHLARSRRAAQEEMRLQGRSHSCRPLLHSPTRLSPRQSQPATCTRRIFCAASHRALPSAAAPDHGWSITILATQWCASHTVAA